MKKVTAGLVILLTAVTVSTAAQRVELGTIADDLQITVIEASNFRTVIRFEVSAFTKEAVEIEGETYYNIYCSNEGILLNEGEPALPHICRSIIIPDEAKMKIRVLDSEYHDFLATPVVPSKGNLPRAVNPNDVPYTFGSIYSFDKWYPSSLASIREPFILRDFRGTVIELNAFQYNPAVKTLRVYTSVTVEVVQDGPGEINILRRHRPFTKVNPDFDLIYRERFINYNKGLLLYTPIMESGDMLIITHDAFHNAMMPFVEWKMQKGIPTTIIDVSTIGNNSALITHFIQDFYDSTDLAWVLLIGDATQVATPEAWGGASDPSYAKVRGTDDYPDIFVGRFSAENLSHVQTQVERTINYEKYPQTSVWYHQGTGIASDLGPGHHGEYDNEHMDYIRDDLLAFTYTLVDQIYDPGANSSQVTNALNNGRSVVNYCGHGTTSSWVTSGFSSSNVNALINDNMLPFIISVACFNGNFDGTTCFGETWLRATHNGNPSGAIATYMSSIGQSWNPPMDAQDEAIDLLVAEAKTTFGGICYNGSCFMIDINGIYGVEVSDTWHIFGDPSVLLYTDTPASMTINHESTIVFTSTQYDIEVVGIENALCALYHDGIIYGSAYTGSDGLASIEIIEPLPVGETISLTVTAFNKTPYITDIQVITPSGPYIIYDSCSVNDIAGNNNGLVDCGESILLGVQLINVGPDDAIDVEAILSTADSFVTITDNSESYGTIPGDNGTAYIPDAFAFDVAGTTPDGHNILFELEVTGTALDTWVSNFTLRVHAPILGFISVIIDDATGNGDGILDPGEMAELVVTLENTGSALAQSVNGALSEDDAFVSIIDGDGYFGDIVPDGGSGDNSGDVFVVSADGSCPIGHEMTFHLMVNADGGYSNNIDFDLAIGSILSYSPTSFNVTSQPGNIEERYLTLTNNSDSPLYYTLWTEIDVLSSNNDNWGLLPEEVRKRPEPLFYRNPDYGKVGAADEPYFPPIITGQGGPDNYGHRWIDSDEPGGPLFNWIDISSIGTPIDFGSDIDDGNSGPLPLGFAFQYYGNEFNSINICTNGWASFTDGNSVEWGNPPIPNAEPPNNMLAAFFDDMNFEHGGTGYYYTNNADTAIITWDHVPDWRQDGIFTFQIILVAPARITYQYAEMGPGRLDECSIGIENQNGNDGLEVAYNASYMHSNLAIVFYTDWLSAFPTSGIVDPHDSFDATITFDASMLSEGTYTGNINLESNDPNNPDEDIPCTFILSSIYDSDIGVSAILSMPDTMFNGIDYLLKSEVSNYGTEPQTFDVLYEVYVSGSSSTEVADTFTIADMPASGVDTVIFSRTFTPTVDTTYEMVSYTVLEGDLNNSNDTSTVTNQSFSFASLWYGNLDGSPISGSPNSNINIDVYIQCFEGAYIANLHVCLGADNQYIADLISDTEGEYFYPLTEWDDVSWSTVFGHPPNPEGWSSQSFLGFALEANNPWLYYETPTRILTFVVVSVDNPDLIGDTVQCFGPGLNPDLLVERTFARDTISMGFYLLNEQFSELCFIAGCDFVPGDINGDGNVMGNDVTFGVRYFKGLGSPPPDSCWNDSTSGWLYSAGDVNGNCQFTGSDITFLVAFFKGYNPSILWCPQTPPSGQTVLSRNKHLTPATLPKE